MDDRQALLPRVSVMSVGDLVVNAAVVAEQYVAPLGRRWRHVQGVARRALELSVGLEADQVETVVSAAWLHDIGYAHEISSTGFHPLDGARWLRGQDWPPEVVKLVAHHSGARFEARERDLVGELAEFEFGDTELDDLVAAADLTTGPGGERLSFDERVAEILTRYEPDSVVHRTWLTAAPTVGQAVARAEARAAARASVRGL
ncbi:HD domain-containing protein [Nocardioides albus]|uniref:Putative nucleotidyltransferase with HDIG domain n=1 Tax=Nocardioides albus TaxID=1841 RepID=A0A7W5AA22_9ACTN|nr:HD domain-containing protein [Nocardioides albus]MBB3092180.1 putative nucleotidyltransferase with HDIG domain [Nocardioides albus]